MRLSTTQYFEAKPDVLWPLLFRSKMDDKHPCLFLCGLPKPVECRLKSNKGGVGNIRECVSDKGVIEQEILIWEPNKRLKFELKETDIYFGPCVKSVVEDFEISVVNNRRSLIKRTTDFKLVSVLNCLASIPMFIGLKAIHRYVFQNWKRLAN
jgi:hypothetical protein